MTAQKNLQKTRYDHLLSEIKERVRSAQYQALRAVNKELISLYWDIGEMIVSRQKRESWGKSIVQQLASDLQKEFPGMQGFSAQNLWYMLFSPLLRLDQMVKEEILAITSSLGVVQKLGGWTAGMNKMKA